MVMYENVVSMEDKVFSDLCSQLREILYFASDNYGKRLNEEIGQISDLMNVSEDLTEDAFFQIAWWAIFCSKLKLENKTIYQIYLEKNQHKLSKKSRHFQQVLISWLHVNPYYVDDDESSSGRVFELTDVFEAKMRIVGMFNDIYWMPKRGELITGLLLPTSDGWYITPAGFLHIPQSLSQTVVNKLLPFYEKNLKSPNYKFNSHLYPDLLTIATQTLDEYYEKSER